MSKANNKNETIRFRLTKNELDKIDEAAAKSNLSRSEYSRKMILEKKDHSKALAKNNSKEDVQKIIYLLTEMNNLIKSDTSEVKKIGTNINQIVRKINRNELNDSIEFKNVLLEMSSIYVQRTNALTKELNKTWRQLQ